MDTGVIIALIGVLSTVVVALITWLKTLVPKMISGLNDRIEALEQQVQECHEKRLEDGLKIANLEKTLAILQQKIIDNSSSPFLCRFHVDSNERIISVQANVKDLLGYDAQELIGESINILIPDDMKGKHNEAFAARVAAPDIKLLPSMLRNNLYAKHKHGGTALVKITIQEIFNGRGDKEFIAELFRILI